MKQYTISSGLAARSALSTNLLYEVLTKLQQLGIFQQMSETKLWGIAAWKLAHASYKELMQQAKSTITQGVGTITSGVSQLGGMGYGMYKANTASREAGTLSDQIDQMDEGGVEGYMKNKAERSMNNPTEHQEMEVALNEHETSETAPSTTREPTEADKSEFDTERKKLVKARERAESRAQQQQQTASTLGRAFGEMAQGSAQGFAAYKFQMQEAQEKENEAVANYQVQTSSQMESEMGDITKNAYQQALAMGTLRTDQASADGQRV